VNNGVERMWKETVVAEFKVLSWNFPGGSGKNHKNSVRKRARRECKSKASALESAC
jgi:hypothetical protein